MVLKLPAGQSLNADQKSQIRQMLADAVNSKSEIDVRIAAWADEPFPGEEKSLSEGQQKLAEKRLASIRKFISETKFDVDDIDTHNMAEGSSWWSRTFNTESNQFKTMISGASPNYLVVKRDYSIFVKEGAPSRSVVVATLDD